MRLSRNFQVSGKTIKKAIETGEVLKGFKWTGKDGKDGKDDKNSNN